MIYGPKLIKSVERPLLRSIEVNWGRNKWVWWVYVNVWRYLTWNVSKVKLSTVTRRREPAEKTVHFLLCFFFQNVSNLLPKNRNNVKNRSNPTTLERLRAAEAEFGTTIGLPKNGAAAGRERVRRCSEERVATRETKVAQHWNRYEIWARIFFRGLLRLPALRAGVVWKPRSLAGWGSVGLLLGQLL